MAPRHPEAPTVFPEASHPHVPPSQTSGRGCLTQPCPAPGDPAAGRGSPPRQRRPTPYLGTRVAPEGGRLGVPLKRGGSGAGRAPTSSRAKQGLQLCRPLLTGRRALPALGPASLTEALGPARGGGRVRARGWGSQSPEGEAARGGRAAGGPGPGQPGPALRQHTPRSGHLRVYLPLPRTPRRPQANLLQHDFRPSGGGSGVSVRGGPGAGDSRLPKAPDTTP